MSLVEKALKSLRELIEPGQQAPPQVAASQRVVRAGSVSPYDEIARYVGFSVADVEKRCRESVDAEEWCSWTADLLRNKRRDPPSKPLPDGVLEILRALLERGFTDPLVEQVVNARRIVQKIISEASEASDSIVRAVVEGRRKLAVESISSLLEKTAREVKRLRGNPDEAVEQVVGSIENALREKYKAPVEKGEIVSAVVDEMKRVGLPSAAEKAVSVIEAKVKKPAEVRPEEIKKLGSQSGEAQVELYKKPFARMPGG